MKAKEIIEQLRQTFNELVTPIASVQFIDAMLQDGTPVQITALEVGGIVTINGVPAPAGEHTLQDGTVIVVGENGAIMEVKPAQAMPEESQMQEDMGAKFSAFESLTNEKFSSYESKFAAYETKFAEYEAKMATATKMIEGLINLTNTLAEAPTGKVDEAVKSTAKFNEEKPKYNYDILFKK
jgi:spore coat protein CotH